jgi:hypothetical protein
VIILSFFFLTAQPASRPILCPCNPR